MDIGISVDRATAGAVTRSLAGVVDLAVVALVAVCLDLAAAGARFAWSPTALRRPRPTPAGPATLPLGVAVG